MIEGSLRRDAKHFASVIQSRRRPWGGWVVEGQSAAKDPPPSPADEDGGFLIALHRSHPVHHPRGSADSE